MIAAVGELDDNSFVCQIQEETAANLGRLAVLRKHIK